METRKKSSANFVPSFEYIKMNPERFEQKADVLTKNEGVEYVLWHYFDHWYSTHYYINKALDLPYSIPRIALVATAEAAANEALVIDRLSYAIKRTIESEQDRLALMETTNQIMR